MYITLDGQIGFQLKPKDRVTITKSKNRVALVRPPSKTYFEVLRSKLGGANGRRRINPRSSKKQERSFGRDAASG